MTSKIAAIGALVATGALMMMAAPDRAHAARQAICEHPEGSRCTATNDTGRIQCQCLDAEHEIKDPTIPGSSEEELLDACWEAWTLSCAPWKLATSCDEADRGSCEVSAADGGTVQCACEHGDIVEHTGVEALDGLEQDKLEGACEEQIVQQCPPRPPAPAEPPATDETFGEPAQVQCAVAPRARPPWLLGLLLVAWGARRRRRG